MSHAPVSVYSLDLNPRSDVTYFDCEREWHEEFIYFLMVDRFDDGRPRQPSETTARSAGSGDLSQLQKFCGGTLQGVTKRLDYIKGLGCTAIWISPIFENSDAPSRDSGKYHGYSIQNYLDIDPRFGTKQDLVDLVGEASTEHAGFSRCGTQSLRRQLELSGRFRLWLLE
jgi:alpha-amylase